MNFADTVAVIVTPIRVGRDKPLREHAASLHSCAIRRRNRWRQLDLLNYEGVAAAIPKKKQTAERSKFDLSAVYNSCRLGEEGETTKGTKVTKHFCVFCVFCGSISSYSTANRYSALNASVSSRLFSRQRRQ